MSAFSDPSPTTAFSAPGTRGFAEAIMRLSWARLSGSLFGISSGPFFRWKCHETRGAARQFVVCVFQNGQRGSLLLHVLRGQFTHLRQTFEIADDIGALNGLRIM